MDLLLVDSSSFSKNGYHTGFLSDRALSLYLWRTYFQF